MLNWGLFLYIDNFTYEDNPSLSTNDYDFNSSVKIYPNPVKNTLHVSGNTIETVDVYSINGKHILSQQLSTQTIDVSNLANGMYFVNLKDANGNTAIKKFIKNYKSSV